MYIIIERKEAIVIDSNINTEVYNLLLGKKVEKVHLFLTHEHYDHSHGVPWFQKHFNTTVYAHVLSKNTISTKKYSNPRLVAFVLSEMDKNDGGHRYEEFKSTVTDYNITPDIFCMDNELFEIAEHSIKISHVPGHSPGSILLTMDGVLLFSGDSLILDNKIITSFRGSNKDDFINVTLPKLKALPNELVVMPGHGSPFMKWKFNFNIYNV